MSRRKSKPDIMSIGNDLSGSVGKLEIQTNKEKGGKRRLSRLKAANKKDSERELNPRTRIYVYVQLKSIENVPQRKHPVEIELTYKGESVQRLDCECVKDLRYDLRKEDATLTFSFPIIQDSIDDLNMVSDHPIFITLFERIRPVVNDSVEEEEEELTAEDEQRVVIAQGYIDILGYFTKKRFSTIIETFIYPTDKGDQIEFGTCKAKWHIYALLPLLKIVDFSNLIFINFESLYNVTEDLLDDAEDLLITLAFRSLLPNEQGKLEINKICTFTGFNRSIIKEQNPYFVWEAAKSNENYTGQNFGLQSENKVNIYKLFKRVLRPENVELNFQRIVLESHEALVCNSMHRFVLTEQLRAMLEDVFVFRQQQLLVQLSRTGRPDEIMLEGAIEPSVLLYPFVNAVRFAVVLTPVAKRNSVFSDSRKSKRKLGSIRDVSGSGDASVPQPLFAIVSMCLLTPISESNDKFADSAQNVRPEKLKFCRRTQSEVIMAPHELLRERAYDDFDCWVADLVDYIVKNKIHDVSDAQNFFCCQSENGSNKILKLIALDFNQRFPTKNNIEFCYLMTTVYKELVERAYNYIKKCGSKGLSRCRKSEQSHQQYIIDIMDFVKIAYEVGNDDLGDFLLNKLNERFPRNVDLNFFSFLHNVELGNFTPAKKYFKLAPKDRRIQDEFVIRILEIYMEYMENLLLEETFNEAYEKLLHNLLEFLKYFHNDVDGWILLYCLYKKSNYLPGMEFARWHYEDIALDKPHREVQNIPLTRWDIFCDYEIGFQSSKSIRFYDSVKLFQSIGAYKFAEIIFDEIAAECADVERYLQSTTLKIFLNEMDPNAGPRNFASANAGPLKAFVSQINGNIFYARGDEEAASDEYKYLVEISQDETIDMQPFELGLRRYAREMSQNRRYEEAVEAYEKCCDLHKSCMVASLHMGEMLYKLGRFEEALERFKISTYYKIHIPDVWAYLALINLKLGNNFNALECWKYAKLNPENVISDEILLELCKVNIDDIDLYVDKPV